MSVDADGYDMIGVDLTIGCVREQVGEITTDPARWRPALAELLRALAAELDADATKPPCLDAG